MTEATIVSAEYQGLALDGKTLPEIRAAFEALGRPRDEISAVSVSYSDGMTVHPFRQTFDEYAEFYG